MIVPRVTIFLILLPVLIMVGCQQQPEPATAPPTATPTPTLAPTSAPNTNFGGVDATLANFAKAYETKNIDLLKLHLTEESSFYAELVINAENTFARYEKIDIEFSEPTINIYDTGKRATVGLKETFKGIGQNGRIIEEISSRDIFELIKSEAVWKITSWYRDIYMRELPSEEPEKK